ncbi:hypothetical protein ONA91_01230 [Micromonospora sp. DR5-3]|uniref:hypothetical protein n=1 Tax=unclassified Micromonospora TaxID=2617518 RepID=UPI0011D42931|nr:MULTISPECIES: hypothetical protein [unclassified Micromonospora]MCW3813081.1 hypothetical protein [Micromonospora sp. DR5-3]TYC25935.1 hypothetical protein FXF52_00735 [Micromonospora sp. MP36]
MGMPDAEGQGPPDGLPDLPPEWGRVVIPDDASALAHEARQVRRELRRLRRRAGWRRRLGLTPRPDGRPPLGLPVLVLLVSVLITLTGLAAVTWPRSSRSGGSPTVLPYPTATPVAVGPLPALDLVGAGESPVPLRSLLPAMIVLVDACACAEQVTQAAAAAPPSVTVVTVTEGRRVEPATAPGVRALADPAGGLRAYAHLAARPGTAPALLVDREGTLVRIVPELGAVEQYRDDLARIAG